MIKEINFTIKGEVFYVTKFSALEFPRMISSITGILELIIDDKWHSEIRKQSEKEFLEVVKQNGVPNLDVDTATMNINKYNLTEAERLKSYLNVIWYCYRNISCLSDLDPSIIDDCTSIVNSEIINKIDIEKYLFGNLYKNPLLRDEINNFVTFILSKTFVFENNNTIKFTFDTLDDIGEKINGDLLYLSEIIYNVLLTNFEEPHKLLKEEISKINTLKKNLS